MIIMLDGTCAELNEVQQRLSQHFEILSANDYNETGTNGRRYIRVKLKPGPGPDGRNLFDLIQAMLADSHHDLRMALEVTPKLEAWHAGLQTGLMTLAKLAGLVPTADESLAELYEQVRTGKLTEQMLVEVNEGAPAKRKRSRNG